jgi:hypothetical protein
MVANLVLLDHRYNFGYIYTDTSIPADTIVRLNTLDKLTPSRRVYTSADGWVPAVDSPNQGLLGFSFSANTFIFGDALKLVNSTETVLVSSYACDNTGMQHYIDFGNQISYSGSGTSCFDLSLSGPRTTTLTNGPTFNSALGGYLVFDGVDDYADVVIPNTSGASVVTIEMWVNVSSFNGGMMFGFNYYDIYTAGGSLGFNTAASDVYGLTSTQVSTLGLVGRWIHYVFNMYMTPTSYTSNSIFINGVSQPLSQVLNSEGGGNKTPNEGNARISGWRADNGYRLPMSLGMFKAYVGQPFTTSKALANYMATRNRFGYELPFVSSGLKMLLDTGYYQSYSGSGAVWNDMSGSSLNATGNASYISSRGITSGAAFSTSSTDILNTDVHSIFFMIRFNSSNTYPNGTTGGWEKIFSYNAGGSDRSPGIWRWPNNRWIHWRYDPGNSGTDFGKNSASLVTNNEFDLNTWYYVGVTKNGASTVMYVNGVQVGTGSVSNPKTAGNAAISINDYYTNPLNTFNSLAIYNRVLTSKEVLQNFNSIKGRFGISDPIIKDGLTLYLDAGNVNSYPGSGTTWTDISYNNKTGTLFNSPTFNISNGGSIVFDGVDDYVTIPTISLGNGNLPWTCSAWIKTSTTVNSLGAGSILSNTSSGPVYSMMGVNNGKIVYWTYQNNAWAQKLGTGKTVNDNNWHFLTWVNYSNNTMDMYVDGVFDSNVTNSTSGNNNPINMIGASWAFYTPLSIAQVYIYNKALSLSNVVQNFIATKSRYGY